ncbi:MAG: helix-turn-helix transcriptional regulator [Acidimicrobiia bacterium]
MAAGLTPTAPPGVVGADRFGAAARDAEPSRHTDQDVAGWSFLTRHGHVLICLAAHPDLRMRQLADAVGLSLRAVYPIVDDLERAGYLVRRRDGRCNRYRVDHDAPLRHPLLAGCTVGQLLAAITAPPAPAI